MAVGIIGLSWLLMLLNGGDFGLDGSLFNWALAVVPGIWRFRSAWRRGQIVAPRWRRSDQVGQ